MKTLGILPTRKTIKKQHEEMNALTKLAEEILTKTSLSFYSATPSEKNKYRREIENWISEIKKQIAEDSPISEGRGCIRLGYGTDGRLHQKGKALAEAINILQDAWEARVIVHATTVNLSLVPKNN